MQEGIYVTEPATDTGWSFPATIGQNIAVYSSQFDSEEVWLGEYFDGADKSVGVVGTMGDTPGSQLSLKDVYVDPKEGADNIFFGGDAFIGGGASDDVQHNLGKYFSYLGPGVNRVYVRPLKKNRMKGLWTAAIDKRGEPPNPSKTKSSVYAPFWKWEKIQPILKFGGVSAATPIEDTDATTNNTIFNHLSTSGDFGNAFATTKDSPLLESIIDLMVNQKL